MLHLSRNNCNVSHVQRLFNCTFNDKTDANVATALAASLYSAKLVLSGKLCVPIKSSKAAKPPAPTDWTPSLDGAQSTGKTQIGTDEREVTTNST